MLAGFWGCLNILLTDVNGMSSKFKGGGVGG